MGKRKASEVNRVYCFFALFCFVYFLESIGGVYMVSAVQSIERQFQIPSKLSGLMISAGDFGYIPTVVFISYMGSKGNRARWIGGGCLLIAFANFLIATPNFVFNQQSPSLNLSTVREKLTPPAYLAYANVTPEELLDFAPVKERMPDHIREKLLSRLRGSGFESASGFVDAMLGEVVDQIVFEGNSDAVRVKRSPYGNSDTVDNDVIEEGKRLVEQILREGENATVFFDFLKGYIRKKQAEGPSDQQVDGVKLSAVAAFGYCNAVVNELRQMIEDMKCARNQTNAGPFAIIFVALLFLGVGRTMPWSLGVPLIDDNVKRKNLPVYFAGMFFIRILGPILGFMIGSLCNRLHYTLSDPIGLSPKDPTWIGAWWLGFLIISAVLFGPSLALFLFPHKPPSGDSDDDDSADDEKQDAESPGAKLNRAPRKQKRSLALVDRHARKTDDGKALVPESLSGKAKDFFSSIKVVLRSPVYSGALVGRIIDVLAFKGFVVFWPKYLESHYGIPQYKVQMLLAVFGVVGFAIGMLAGSVVMRKFKLEGRKAAMFVAVCSLFAAITSFSDISLGCTSVVNKIGELGKNTTFNYTTTCNADCLCDSVSLFPVCDKSGAEYYSPCHAGCRAVNVTDLITYDMTFTDCKCVSSGNEARRDWCVDDCETMTKLYFAVGIVSGIIGGLGVIPGIMIILRSVPPEHRSISLGFSGFLVSLLATLPSPILWGFLIDSACLVWERTCTGDNGSCTIYDPTMLRNRMHIFYGLLRLLALTTDIWVWYYAKNLKLMSEEEEEPETLRDRHVEGAESKDSQNNKNAKEMEALSK